MSECQMCQRGDVQLTFHHLIPKKVHGRKVFLRKYKKAFMQQHGINICKLCHNGLHRMFNEVELANRFHTLELIIEDDVICKHIEWVRKQKGEKRG